MRRAIMGLTAAALISVSGSLALAQQHHDRQQMGTKGAQMAPPCTGTAGQGMQGGGMMQRGDMMQSGERMDGNSGHHRMPTQNMQFMMAIVDADGNGMLSLEEVLEMHRRLFIHADADANGQLTLEEIERFMGDGMPSN